LKGRMRESSIKRRLLSLREENSNRDKDIEDMREITLNERLESKRETR
jgi:hypothetical protein